LNQAGIDCKAFAPNQTGPNACLDHAFEHAAENISVAKALVAGAGKCRMIWDGVFYAKLAEPAVSEVSPALHG
jgi:hypothetical protein